MSDMLCEKHLDLEWPHEDCPGPGVPIISGMRARISELETELLKQYRRVEDLISDSRVMERESAALRKRVEELETKLRDADLQYAKEYATRVDYQNRAEKAGADRDEAMRNHGECGMALSAVLGERDKLQADLDAALKWIEGYTDGPSGLGPTSQRVRALLEKRREKRG